MLFASYRRGDANDPDGYVAAISIVLSMYHMDIIREVTDPRTGIAATEKYMSFMPNAGELKIYCDGVAARKSRLLHLASLPKPNFSRPQLEPPQHKPGRFANTFISSDNDLYPRAVEFSRTASDEYWKTGDCSGRDGIWVCMDVMIAI